ncbi:MAG TPA: LysR family transcriptional regulator substrate-binding protein, partial [Blastocatellia bacterium]|nr:LysR family transcriptional regulator substrate-binding protein [Blastocatellia bacterium]
CLVLITNASHPAMRKARVSIKNLADETLILYTVDDESRKQTLSALSRQGIQPHIEVTGGTIRSVKSAVAENLGVALVPSQCVTDEIERGEFLSGRVEGLDVEWKVWEVHRRSDDRTYIRGAMTVLSTMSRGADFRKAEPALSPRESPGRIPYVIGQ